MTMPARDEETDVRALPTTRDLGARMTGLEVTVAGAAADIAEFKATIATHIDQTDKRFRMLEDVRIRAVEDQLKVDKALAQERERVAKEAALREQEEQAEHQRRQLSSRQFWIGTAAIVIATIVAALIASGRI